MQNGGGWGWPFHGLIYDEPRDRFFVPGLYSVDRLGNVTLDPEPMTGPSGAALQRFDEIQDALGFCRWKQGENVCDSGLQAIIAVWYGPKTIVVLSRKSGRARNAESFDFPNEVFVAVLDAQTLEGVGGAFLEVPELWTPWGIVDPWRTTRMLDRFIRDGTVIIDAGLGPRGRRGGHRLAHGSGRIGRVRVDSTSGALTTLYRNKWHAAAAEFGLPDAAALRKLFGRWIGGLDARSSPSGVYVHEADYREGGHYLASYDRELELQWRRSIPSPVTHLFVDDSGWIYFGVMGPRIPVAPGEHLSTKFELIALTPRGEVAWTWVHRPKPPDKYWESLTVGTLMAAGDDLCFSLEGYSRLPVGGSYPPPELVCISPRHGRPVE